MFRNVHGSIKSPEARLARVDEAAVFEAEYHIWDTPGYVGAMLFGWDEPEVWAELVDWLLVFDIEFGGLFSL